MFRRIAVLAAFAVILFAAVGAQAATTDNAYIVIRCTATISVEYFSGGSYSATDWYNFGDVSANATAVSTAPIGIRNNSVGAICKWEMDVTNIANTPPGGEWTLGSTRGLNRAVMYAKISTNTVTSGQYNVVNDTVSLQSQGAKEYSSNTYYNYCSEYVESTYTTNASIILPSSYDAVKSERHLWLRIDTPSAVENSGAITTITLRVTAKSLN